MYFPFALPSSDGGWLIVYGKISINKENHQSSLDHLSVGMLHWLLHAVCHPISNVWGRMDCALLDDKPQEPEKGFGAQGQAWASTGFRGVLAPSCGIEPGPLDSGQVRSSLIKVGHKELRNNPNAQKIQWKVKAHKFSVKNRATPGEKQGR